MESFSLGEISFVNSIKTKVGVSDVNFGRCIKTVKGKQMGGLYLLLCFDYRITCGPGHGATDQGLRSNLLLGFLTSLPGLKGWTGN